MLNITANSLADLPNAAKQLVNFANGNNFWAFYGEMGAGKTTLINAICQYLQIDDTVSSPTFSIVNQYLTKQSKIIYHFDFYRIKSVNEAIDMGAEEYFYSGNLCLVEWPERVQPIIDQTYLKINISLQNPLTRLITATFVTP